jgi:hypothetical protein
MADISPDHTSDRDHVGVHQGVHQGSGVERDNGVERSIRADIDQRNQAAEEASEDDRIDRDLTLRINFGNPSRTGKAPITSKSPRLTRGGGIEHNIAKNDR